MSGERLDSPARHQQQLVRQRSVSSVFTFRLPYRSRCNSPPFSPPPALIPPSSAAAKHDAPYDSVPCRAGKERLFLWVRPRWPIALLQASDVTALVHAQGGETLARRRRGSAEVKAATEGNVQQHHAELEPGILFLGQGEGPWGAGAVLSQGSREARVRV